MLQADAGAGYDKIFADGHMREAACMVHARAFHHLLITRATTITEALRRIAQLYAIGEQLRASRRTGPKRLGRTGAPDLPAFKLSNIVALTDKRWGYGPGQGLRFLLGQRSRFQVADPTMKMD